MNYWSKDFIYDNMYCLYASAIYLIGLYNYMYGLGSCYAYCYHVDVLAHHKNSNFYAKLSISHDSYMYLKLTFVLPDSSICLQHYGGLEVTPHSTFQYHVPIGIAPHSTPWLLVPIDFAPCSNRLSPHLQNNMNFEL